MTRNTTRMKLTEKQLQDGREQSEREQRVDDFECALEQLGAERRNPPAFVEYYLATQRRVKHTRRRLLAYIAKLQKAARR